MVKDGKYELKKYSTQSNSHMNSMQTEENIIRNLFDPLVATSPCITAVTQHL